MVKIDLNSNEGLRNFWEKVGIKKFERKEDYVKTVLWELPWSIVVGKIQRKENLESEVVEWWAKPSNLKIEDLESILLFVLNEDFKVRFVISNFDDMCILELRVFVENICIIENRKIISDISDLRFFNKVFFEYKKSLYLSVIEEVIK